MNVFTNEDCMEVMARYPDNHFDLAIVDPPYGIGIDGQNKSINKNPKHNRKEHKDKGWDSSIPEMKYFCELFRVSRNQIIWGANYFVEFLSEGKKGWIIWDKGQKGLTMSDCEIAFSSFSCPTRIFELNRRFIKQHGGSIHPTQKPVALYKWLLSNYAKEGDLILDTHVGSASSLIACEDKGFNYVGCELDPDYFRDANKRLAKFRQQPKLNFSAQPKPEPEQLSII